MKHVKIYACRAVGIIAAVWMSAMPAWGGLVTDETGQISYLDEQGNGVKNQWVYEDEKNEWYYLKEDGFCAQGKTVLGEDIYFFDENGKMLTGWITYQRNEIPEAFFGVIDREDVYYCGDDGKMVKGWAESYSPEAGEYEDPDIFEKIQKNSYHRNRYYFKEDGKICRNEKKRIDGKLYIFDTEAVCVKGWIYDSGEDAGERYISVNTDSDDAVKALCRENPQNLMFGLAEGGFLAEERFVDSIPAWDNDGDDSRSFYVDSSGYIVTAYGGRGSGSSVAARRKLTKIKEAGRYQLEDNSTDVNITKIDGKYYCLEDSGTRMDGVVYLSGGEQEEAFCNGIYGFIENAAMQTGAAVIENKDGDDEKDGYHYYYYFADRKKENVSKGQGITGVEKNRLYYQGLAVGAQDESLEVVYLPTLEEQDDCGYGTGFFLVDQAGRVKKGSKTGSTYSDGEGRTYKVYKDNDHCDKYGYRMEYCDGDKDEDGKKIWNTLLAQDCAYLCWDAVEE